MNYISIIFLGLIAQAANAMDQAAATNPIPPHVAAGQLMLILGAAGHMIPAGETPTTQNLSETEMRKQLKREVVKQQSKVPNSSSGRKKGHSNKPVQQPKRHNS